MGDVPGGGHPSGNFTNVPPTVGRASSRHSTPGQSESHDPFRSQHGANLEGTPQGTQVPFQSQMQQQFYHPQQYRQIQQPLIQTVQSSLQDQGRGSTINMSTLASALPDVSYGQAFIPQQTGRSPSGPPAASPYQFQQVAPYQGLSGPGQSPGSHYTMQFPQQYQGMYPANQQMSPQVGQAGTTATHQYYQTQGFIGAPQPQQLPQYFFQQGQYPTTSAIYPASSYPSQYGSRTNVLAEGGQLGRQISNEQLLVASRQGSTGRSGSAASNTAQSSTPRGPPRKPKQSGHALWVGNLPPGANVVDLKEHFSRDATDDILSVFLISKSNCAFVNYKSESSCAAAMARFHDSRFQGVRLVCRLRRNPANASTGVTTGPAPSSSSQLSSSKASATGPETQPQENKQTVDAEVKESTSELSQAKEKFFIVKSLTVEDLELSVRNGIWATQSHNEEALNKAYETTEAVYLIFSANKSGEYFGYARMTSAINEDPAAAIEFAPKAQAAEDPDLPKAILTEATEFAPKGRIIDDSARGTIFWEAEVDEAEIPGDLEETHSDISDPDGEQSPMKAWGKPFKIEWLSTNRLPFYRTRGLRNPWNSNREVKIARDGTELETSVGRRLIQMFHRQSPTIPNPQMQMPPMMGGYPQMRPY